MQVAFSKTTKTDHSAHDYRLFPLDLTGRSAGPERKTSPAPQVNVVRISVAQKHST